MATVSLIDIDFVRELVDVIRAARKVRFELRARRRDRFHDPVRELGILESDRELRGDLVPKTRGYFLIEAFVAEDRELFFFAREKQQHSVAQRGLRHAEAFESALGDEANVAAGDARLDVYADLARRLLFRVGDRFHDARLIDLFEKLFVRHHQPPLAPPPPNEPPPPEKPPN